jgi:hypothetical protein
VCCVNPRVYVSVQDYKNQFDSCDSRVKVASHSTWQTRDNGRKELVGAMGGLVQMCVASLATNYCIIIIQSGIHVFKCRASHSLRPALFNPTKIPWPPKKSYCEWDFFIPFFNGFLLNFRSLGKSRVNCGAA